MANTRKCRDLIWILKWPGLGHLQYLFTLRPARSRRIGAEKIADVEFADDVALVADTIEGAKLLLDRLEKAALSVGLTMNDT